MAMRGSGGGGYGSRNVKHVTASKVEPRAHAINPSWVAQRGALVGNHATNTRGSTDYTGAERSLGRGYSNPVENTEKVAGAPIPHGRIGRSSCSFSMPALGFTCRFTAGSTRDNGPSISSG